MDQAGAAFFAVGWQELEGTFWKQCFHTGCSLKSTERWPAVRHSEGNGGSSEAAESEVCVWPWLCHPHGDSRFHSGTKHEEVIPDYQGTLTHRPGYGAPPQTRAQTAGAGQAERCALVAPLSLGTQEVNAPSASGAGAGRAGNAAWCLPACLPSFLSRLHDAVLGLSTRLPMRQPFRCVHTNEPFP